MMLVRRPETGCEENMMSENHLEVAAAILTQAALESFRAIASTEFVNAAVPADTKAFDGVQELVRTTYNKMLHVVGAVVTNPDVPK
jgi:hypothetical protein